MTQVYVFDVEDTETAEASQKYFLQYFPDSHSHSARFFAIEPGLSNGKIVSRLKCFQLQNSVYALVEASMSRNLVEHLIETVKKAEAKEIFLAVLGNLPNFMIVFKTLAFIGFVQVDPRIQRKICTAPAVLMHLGISNI